MSDEIRVGQVLNERYEIVEVIGSGGMATVYKASCRLLNRFVAIKVLKSSLKSDSEIIEKFNREARAVAALSHNNIVSVYDVGETDEGLSYIVMEYVDGITLKEYINQHKPLKWQDAVSIAVQIGNALSHAHEHGIIHRDIKPHNILLTRDMTVKVADFGIARAVSTDTVIAGGSAMGSVYYMSPEQARGGYVDVCSDIYSLGVVMYEMLTGTLPFTGDNAVSIALMQLEKEPLHCKVINLDIPQSIDEIVMKAISKEQRMRYQSAAEMVSAMERVLEGDSLHMRQPSEEAEEEYSGRRRKKSSFNPIIGSAVLLVIFAVGAFLLMRGCSPRELQVPDVLNLTLEEALTSIENTDFTIDEDKIEYEVSDEIEEGRIISQDPGANASVKRNTKLKVVISSGNGEGNLEVPNVVGDDLSTAIEKLVNGNLKYQIIEESGAEEDINTVVSQSPKNGMKVTSGYTVIIHVCKTVENSKQELEVPNVLGMTRSEAKQELEKVGLQLGNVSKAASDKPEGEVIKQEPVAGSESPKGSYVNIVISESASEPAQTPTSEPTAQPATQAPTAQPTTQPATQTPQEVKRKTLSVIFPESAEDPVQVRVLADGKEIHNKSYPKSAGQADIVVTSSTKKDVQVEVYMNGEKVANKVVSFE